ncbi:MAG: hypothetical protein AAGA92_08065 [Planctomycetota bacterium]
MSESSRRASEAAPETGSEQHVELMVAYLDGELSPEEVAGVERRLGADESFRTEMRRVEAAWEALDQLPVATVDDDFSKTTLALVAADVRGGLEARTSALPAVQSRGKRLSWLGAAAVAVLGFLCLRLMSTGPDRWLVRDLPSIQYIDVYTQFQDAELLLGLEAELGDRVWAPGVSEEELSTELQEFTLVAASDSRREYLAGLSDSERSSLRMRQNRFRAMPQQEQERVRALHSEVTEMPSAARAALLQYRHWLAGLEDYERFELRQMNESGEVKAVVDRAKQLIRESDFVLNKEELKVFGELVESTKRELMSEFKSRRRKQSGDAATRELARALSESPDRRYQFFNAARRVLSEEKRNRFDELPFHRQAATIQSWMVQLRNERSSSKGGVSAAELEDFFVEELPVERKAQLLSQPVSSMERRLRQMYLLGDEPPRGPRGFDEERGPRRGLPGPPRIDRDRRGFGPPGRPDGPRPDRPRPGSDGRYRKRGFPEDGPPPRPPR